MTEIEPTTGVYSGGDLPWEWIDTGNYIDLAYEEARTEAEEEIRNDVRCAGDWPPLAPEEVEYAVEQELEERFSFWEGCGEQLYGDWIKVNAAGEPDENGKYAPDPDGEFALIYDSNYNVGQLVYSKWVRYGQPASPCYPGQVDARPDDPDQPEGGEVNSAAPVEQIFCTAPRTKSVPYYAFPKEAYE